MQPEDKPITPLECVQHQIDRLTKQLEHAETDLKHSKNQVMTIQAEIDALNLSIRNLSDWAARQEPQE